MKDRTILIVDDMPFDREVLSGILARKLECTIIEASSSSEALEILGTQDIDLILLDVEMPTLSGDDAVSHIRKNSSLADLPIIMISGNSDESMIIKCLKAGANDFILKPINFEIAITRILNHLKLSGAIKDRVKLREMATLNAMVATYNHEINNPLTIALTGLSNIEVTSKEDVWLKKVEKALLRISDILVNIKKVTKENEVLFETYTGTGKMVKIK